MVERYEIVLQVEAVRIPSEYVVDVQYQSSIDKSKQWVLVHRRDGLELKFPIRTWDDVTVEDRGNGLYVVTIKVDWIGSVAW